VSRFRRFHISDLRLAALHAQSAGFTVLCTLQDIRALCLFILRNVIAVSFCRLLFPRRWTVDTP